MQLRFITTIFRLLVSACTIITVSCSSNLSNGGLETTNGFVTAFVTDDTIYGSTNPGAHLILCDVDFNRDTTSSLLIDSTASAADGSYRFTNLPKGFYNLLVRSQNDNLSALVAALPVNQSSSLYQDSAALTTGGDISGTVLLNESIRSTVNIFVPGTPFSSQTDSTGRFIISDIPQGNYQIVASLVFYTRDTPRVFSANDTVLITDSKTVTDTLHLTLTQ